MSCLQSLELHQLYLLPKSSHHESILCVAKLATRLAWHMQSVWSGQKRMIGTFLHSPMLDELKSLENILMGKVCDVEQAAEGVRSVPAVALQP